MLLSIFLGLMLGVYSAYVINIFNENKSSKYIVYWRFLILVSISILGPAAIYLLRIFEGEGPDGDTPLLITAIFCICSIGSLIVFLKKK